MGKYAPLGDYLRSRRTGLVPMTFVEIERVIGFRLPNSQCYPAWWSNNPTNNVMTRVWLDAGFETEQVDIEGRKLVFRRVDNPPVAPSTGAKADVREPPSASPGEQHPFYGWMKGTVRTAPGVDLTEPADPEWADRLDADQ
jgi:hypothetical protein